MYHANMFSLTKNEPLPAFVYGVNIVPKPINKPQLYQILGSAAKQILRTEKKPVVSSREQVMSLAFPISKLTGHSAEIPEVGRFKVDLVDAGNSIVTTDQFDDYRLFVNRLADIALTVLSSEYYKFHPDAPFIVRDEPYFDSDLIGKTGIIDSKKYYRGLHKFNDQLVFVLNRETQLRSNGNLLNEIRSLKKLYEIRTKLDVDFYDPSKEFIDFVNSLLRGKAAEVLAYPGPSVREIKEITWKYRAKDTIPGSTRSNIDYLRDTYGVTGLDPDQPLVVYEVQMEGKKRIQHHIPEVLSIGHTFSDLEKRIPRWQRTQVWGVIHPDCKNQLQKICGVLFKIDETLRANLPEVYPRLVEISTKALDVSALVSQAIQLSLQFGNKTLQIKSPYDVEFYRQYTDKKVSFAKPIGDVKALVYSQAKSAKIDAFLTALALEFKLRNNSELTFDHCTEINFEETDYSKCQVIITIGDGDEEETYRKCKELLQNTFGVVHQHVTEEHANVDSVMALVMELNLKLGGDPWLIADKPYVPCVVGIHSYLNPFSLEEAVFVNAFNGNGSLSKQFDPIAPKVFEKVSRELVHLNQQTRRVLYLTSFDRFYIIDTLKNALDRMDEEIEYCIAEVEDQDYIRFFETWIPKKAPRFGEAATELSRSPVEAYQSAPQGVALKSDDETFFLLTGKTIEKDATKRGCPMPIRLTIRDRKGSRWDTSDIANYVFALCMMGRASGHMTRFPSPLYYPQSYAYYCSNFGVPKDGKIKQRIFYI